MKWFGISVEQICETTNLLATSRGLTMHSDCIQSRLREQMMVGKDKFTVLSDEGYF